LILLYKIEEEEIIKSLQNIRKQISKTIERFLYFAEDHKKGVGKEKK